MLVEGSSDEVHFSGFSVVGAALLTLAPTWRRALPRPAKLSLAWSALGSHTTGDRELNPL